MVTVADELAHALQYLISVYSGEFTTAERSRAIAHAYGALTRYKREARA